MKIMRLHAVGKNLVRAGDEKQVISLQWPYFENLETARESKTESTLLA